MTGLPGLPSVSKKKPRREGGKEGEREGGEEERKEGRKSPGHDGRGAQGTEQRPQPTWTSGDKDEGSPALMPPWLPRSVLSPCRLLFGALHRRWGARIAVTSTPCLRWENRGSSVASEAGTKVAVQVGAAEVRGPT